MVLNTLPELPYLMQKNIRSSTVNHFTFADMETKSQKS